MSKQFWCHRYLTEKGSFLSWGWMTSREVAEEQAHAAIRGTQDQCRETWLVGIDVIPQPEDYQEQVARELERLETDIGPIETARISYAGE
jgi:hypothetical protein